ncbi:MAG: hypothetical protein HN728_04410 [Flavobacteriales bacterium]|jgi:hypothetical protein|nr:hypothetical protein [Flavobacteriales bacterium]MBT5131650.1 hypothetical protein [Flavobacteriales bacterium]MBT5716501.1 hypothetical protein [Opitutae bacterium]MBT5976037.1 hypothetical protein [Flavobacteriales bacterium]MBT7749062.1 hypothetical protein [Flavobacteriales bacterium]
MKNQIAFLASLLTFSICLAQEADTLQFDVGQPDGFQRIREFHTNGQFKKVTITSWKKNGNQETSFSEYNAEGERISEKAFTYNAGGAMIKSARQIADGIESDEQFFNSKGKLLRRKISIYVDNKYCVFEKSRYATWTFRTLVDGNPPYYEPLTEERFEEVVQLYNDLLLLHKIAD